MKILIGLLGLMLITSAGATNGVYEINAACRNVGCFMGDNPSTTAVEITDVVGGGTFRLSSDLNVNASSAININSTHAIIIDLNGYQLTCLTQSNCNANGINIIEDNDVLIQNGSINGFFDNIHQATINRSGRVVIENMLLTNASDDAVSGRYGIVRNSVFRNNAFGINSIGSNNNPGAWVIEDNFFYDSREFISQDVLFGDSRADSCSGNVVTYGGTLSLIFCVQLTPNQCGSQLCAQSERVSTRLESKPE